MTWGGSIGMRAREKRRSSPLLGMKIYFGFTVAGDRSSLDIARRVVELLESKGHEVLTRHLVSDNAWKQDRLITP